MANMKLSTAMLRGDKIMPQTAHARLFGRAGKIVAACAMGKAYIGIHGLEKANEVRGNVQAAYNDLYDRYGLRGARAVDPEVGVERLLKHIIWDLNDGRYWTTEQIAMWLKRIGR